MNNSTFQLDWERLRVFVDREYKLVRFALSWWKECNCILSLELMGCSAGFLKSARDAIVIKIGLNCNLYVYIFCFVDFVRDN